MITKILFKRNLFSNIPINKRKYSEALTCDCIKCRRKIDWYNILVASARRTSVIGISRGIIHYWRIRRRLHSIWMIIKRKKGFLSSKKEISNQTGLKMRIKDKKLRKLEMKLKLNRLKLIKFKSYWEFLESLRLN